MYSVYALADPRTNEVRYIGCSKNVRHRYYHHMHNRENNNVVKRDWIADLKAKGIKPTLSILEEFTSKRNALDSEVYWLQFYARQGAPLTNMRDAEICDDELWPGTEKWRQDQISRYPRWKRGEYI